MSHIMSDLPRYWSLQRRRALHPIVPTKAKELLLFITAGLFLAVGPLYVISAYFRRLLSADEAIEMYIPLLVGGGVFLILGILCRRRRLKKLKAYQQSKRDLASGFTKSD